MPLFGNKFSPKKTTPRKSVSLSSLHREFEPVQNQREFGLDFDKVSVKLGNRESVFEDGQWVLESGSPGAPVKEMAKLKRQNGELNEENNILKLKIELLFDMLAEATAENHFQEKEIEEIKQKSRRKQ